MVRHHIVPGLRPCVLAFWKAIWTAAGNWRAPWPRFAERLGNVEASSLEHEHVSWKSSATICLRNSMLSLQQLAKARAGEYREIIVGDKALFRPSSSQSHTGAASSRLGFLAPLWPSTSPLSPDETAELYRTMCQFT